MDIKGQFLALAGGVGGAKLVSGLARTLASEQLIIVANTGDDEVFHGLHISPDLDTLMYNLAGLANPLTGWGLANESFRALEMLGKYGADAWFKLGDGDLATHIERTRHLYQGKSLSEITQHLCNRLGIRTTLAPMSDQPVRTVVETPKGNLSFQDYFVKQQCKPTITGVHFTGIEKARMSPIFAQALQSAQAIVFCPSNPVVSIGPILAVSGVRELLETFRGPRIAVSPIVGGQSLRGPAAKMLFELGEDVTCVGIAKRLRGVCDILVIDTQDKKQAPDVRATGIEPMVTDIIMETEEDKDRLAAAVLGMIRERLEE